MNRIVKIFMERDKMSREDAEQEYSDLADEVLDCVHRGAVSEADDVMLGRGLEPDYLEDIIFGIV